MADYLVTGGAGFIGSHIVEALVADGHKVRVLDNLSTGKKENLSSVLDRRELIIGDIRDSEVVEEAVARVGHILHQAAIPSVARSFHNPEETLSVNCGGTLQLLAAARGAGDIRFIFASSSSVYGDRNDFKPKSPYGASKLLGEQYCLLYHRLYGLNTVCLRYFNVFGARQDPDTQYAAVVPLFIKLLKTGQQPVIDGDGGQSRDFTYVKNVVKANLTINKPGVYDIGCGREKTVSELCRTIKEILDVDIDPVYGPPRPGDIRSSRAVIDESVYQPDYFMEQGLRILLGSLNFPNSENLKVKGDS